MRTSEWCGQRGFAFLWVLLAVAMLGLLVASAADVVSVQQRRDRELQLLSIGREFRAALRQYHDCPTCDGGSQYPSALVDLLLDPRHGAEGHRYLRKIYVDPVTGVPDWGIVRDGSAIVGIYSKSMEKPLMQHGFVADEMSFNAAASYQAWIFAAQPIAERR